MSTPDPRTVFAVATVPAPGSVPLAAVQPALTREPRPHRTTAQVVKDIVLFVAAPFVTMAYLFLFPFIGVAMFARAWRHRREAG
jgi:hypothetical protein